MTLTPTVVQAGCAGHANGSVSVLIAGGTQPYTVHWSNGFNQTINTSSGTSAITSLTAGAYWIKVTDSAAASDQLSFLLADSDLTLDFEIKKAPNGRIKVIATGQSPYTYLWSTTATTDTISGLAAGTYWVTVTDNYGCSVTQVISLVDHDQDKINSLYCCQGQLSYLYAQAKINSLKCVHELGKKLFLLTRWLKLLCATPLALVNDSASASATGSGSSGSTSVSLNDGAKYTIKVTVTGMTTGSAYYEVGNASGNVYQNGVQEVCFTASATTSIGVLTDSTFDGTITLQYIYSGCAQGCLTDEERDALMQKATMICR